MCKVQALVPCRAGSVQFGRIENGPGGSGRPQGSNAPPGLFGSRHSKSAETVAWPSSRSPIDRREPHRRKRNVRVYPNVAKGQTTSASVLGVWASTQGGYVGVRHLDGLSADGSGGWPPSQNRRSSVSHQDEADVVFVHSKWPALFRVSRPRRGRRRSNGTVGQTSGGSGR
jgi:hypothetical protein